MPIKTSFFGYVREFDLNGENINWNEPRGMEVDYERCRPST